MDLVISPDGKHIYISGEYSTIEPIYGAYVPTGSLIRGLSRDVESGMLELDGLIGGNPGNYPDLITSTDGRHVYSFNHFLLNVQSVGISIFNRDSSTGQLTPAEDIVIPDEANNLEYMKFSPDGKYLYLIGGLEFRDTNDITFMEFKRDESSGKLQLNQSRHQHDGFPAEYDAIAFITDNQQIAFRTKWNTCPGYIMLADLDKLTGQAIIGNFDSLFHDFDWPQSEPIISSDGRFACVPFGTGFSNLYQRNTVSGALSRFFDTRNYTQSQDDDFLYVIDRDALSVFGLDSDGDSIIDRKEVDLGINPLQDDTDGDGLIDGDEIEHGSDPKLTDSDGDGVEDGIEVNQGRNPKMNEPLIILIINSTED
ncbi:MAG: hypothetical protein A3I78_05635 [Gammaproteobacteria bacterium RIFCSPLOWO2_02_FULL_56_15]|nr:MAG: hypothetical protein A3I78_05635 [Gammaproteobacteria bacterium RIFCSPLOWO2_02_FULL_56_15]